MARLDPVQTEILRKAIDSCTSDWIIAGAEWNEASALRGPVGYFDWRLHGQVSRLLARGELMPGRLCVVAGPMKLGKSKLLLVPPDHGMTPSQLSQRLKLLGAHTVTLEESGFSKDFLAKLKDNLSKEQIEWSTLDWQIH